MPQAFQTFSDFQGANLNVKMFEAKGNGVDDDYAAFQHACNSLVALGGGKLSIPAGVYRIGRGEGRGEANGPLQFTHSGFYCDGITIEFHDGAKILMDNINPDTGYGDQCNGLAIFGYVEGLKVINGRVDWNWGALPKVRSGGDCVKGIGTKFKSWVPITTTMTTLDGATTAIPVRSVRRFTPGMLLRVGAVSIDSSGTPTFGTELVRLNSIAGSTAGSGTLNVTRAVNGSTAMPVQAGARIVPVDDTRWGIVSGAGTSEVTLNSNTHYIVSLLDVTLRDASGASVLECFALRTGPYTVKLVTTPDFFGATVNAPSTATTIEVSGGTAPCPNNITFQNWYGKDAPQTCGVFSGFKNLKTVGTWTGDGTMADVCHQNHCYEGCSFETIIGIDCGDDVFPCVNYFPDARTVGPDIQVDQKYGPFATVTQVGNNSDGAVAKNVQAFGSPGSLSPANCVRFEQANSVQVLSGYSYYKTSGCTSFSGCTALPSGLPNPNVGQSSLASINCSLSNFIVIGADSGIGIVRDPPSTDGYGDSYSLHTISFTDLNISLTNPVHDSFFSNASGFSVTRMVTDGVGSRIIGGSTFSMTDITVPNLQIVGVLYAPFAGDPSLIPQGKAKLNLVKLTGGGSLTIQDTNGVHIGSVDVQASNGSSVVLLRCANVTWTSFTNANPNRSNGTNSRAISIEATQDVTLTEMRTTHDSTALRNVIEVGGGSTMLTGWVISNPGTDFAVDDIGTTTGGSCNSVAQVRVASIVPVPLAGGGFKTNSSGRYIGPIASLTGFATLGDFSVALPATPTAPTGVTWTNASGGATTGTGAVLTFTVGDIVSKRIRIRKSVAVTQFTSNSPKVVVQGGQFGAQEVYLDHSLYYLSAGIPSKVQFSLSEIIPEAEIAGNLKLGGDIIPAGKSTKVLGGLITSTGSALTPTALFQSEQYVPLLGWLIRGQNIRFEDDPASPNYNNFVTGSDGGSSGWSMLVTPYGSGAVAMYANSSAGGAEQVISSVAIASFERWHQNGAVLHVNALESDTVASNQFDGLVGYNATAGSVESRISTLESEMAAAMSNISSLFGGVSSLSGSKADHGSTGSGGSPAHTHTI